MIINFVIKLFIRAFALSLTAQLFEVDKKSQFIFRLILGIIVITAVVFLAFTYLMKGPPVIKVMAIGLVAGTAYLVIDYLIKKHKENE